MKYLILLSTLLFTTAFAECQKDVGQYPVLSSNDFSWGMSLEQIQATEKRIIEENKRLPHRAYLEDGKFFMPTKDGKRFEIPSKFIKSVTSHVEKAFERKYIHALIFPDMGHSHFFIPHERYEELRRLFSGSDTTKFYEALYKEDNLKMLYHTAEQLKMLDDDKKLIDDRIVQWRFFTRNLIGTNIPGQNLEFSHNETHAYNTSRSYNDKFRYWGSGFSISIAKEGCFEFNRDGKKYRFDLSLYDPEPIL